MVATKDIQLAEEIARGLRAQGEPERAAALEAVLSFATGVLQERAAAEDYWTVRQAAQATGLPGPLIRHWIAGGQLPAVIRGGRTLIRQDDFWACVDALPSPPPPRPLTPAERAAERRRQAFIESRLPADKRTRLEHLHERMEDGHRLSRAERSEMITLERELVALAGELL